MRAFITVLVIASCLIAANCFSTVYDDAYARQLFKVNGAAYSKDPANCVKNIVGLGSDWSVVKTFEVPSSPTKLLKATVAFIILKSDVQKQYIISFRGTVGNDQLIAQFISPLKAPFKPFGNVNTYFQNSFKLLWPSIATTISNAKQEGYSIVVTGFSLGGALASITALKVVTGGYQTPENTYLLTFGAPRVGNSEFAEKVDKLLKYSHRVVNEADLIPHIPPCFSFGGNSCTKLLGAGYYHSQQEIWYASGSAAPNSVYVTTKVNEDPHGSNALGTKRALADHLQYFGIDPERYAGLNCVG